MSIEAKKVGLREVEIEKVLFVKTGRISGFKVDDLAEDIKKNGLLEPIIVEEDRLGNYTVIAGGRRFYACQKLGWTKVPAIVYKGLTDEEKFQIMFSENIVRKNFSPVEVAAIVQAYVRLGHSGEEAAANLGMGADEVSQYLYIAEKLPKPVKEFIADSKNIGLEACFLLAKLAEIGMSEQELTNLSRDLERGALTIDVLRSMAARRLPAVQGKAIVVPPEKFQELVEMDSRGSKPQLEQPTVKVEPSTAVGQPKIEVQPYTPQPSVQPSPMPPSPPQPSLQPQTLEEKKPPQETYVLEFIFHDGEKYDLVYNFFAKPDGTIDSEKLYNIVLEKMQ